MTSPASSRGFLVTFRPCGHVTHCPAPPEPGSWLTHWGQFTGPAPRCQSPREVAAVEQCPGCPLCPGWTTWRPADWRQPSLFDDLGRAA